jgi:hypothetical protein
MDLMEIKNIAQKVSDVYESGKAAKPIDALLVVVKGKNYNEKQLQRITEASNKAIWRKYYLKGGKKRTGGFELIDSKKVIAAIKGVKVTPNEQTALAKTKGASSTPINNKEASMDKVASDPTPRVDFNYETKQYNLTKLAFETALNKLPGKDPTLMTKEASDTVDFNKQRRHDMLVNELVIARDKRVKDLRDTLNDTRNKIAHNLGSGNVTIPEVMAVFHDTSWFEDIIKKYDDGEHYKVAGYLNKEHELVKAKEAIEKLTIEVDKYNRYVEKARQQN